MFAEVVSTCMTIDRNGLDKICIYRWPNTLHYFEDEVQVPTGVLEDKVTFSDYISTASWL